MRKGIEAHFEGFIAIKRRGSVDRSVESVDPVFEIRWASLGASQIPIHGADLTEARPQNRNP
jgi:hypothetical protein